MLLCLETAAEFTMVAGECEILSLAIEPGSRGRGHGRGLLQALLSEAGNLNCRKCFLEVRCSNDAAIALYTGAGFTLDGVRSGYYRPLHEGEPREDALLYSLSLES